MRCPRSHLLDIVLCLFWLTVFLPHGPCKSLGTRVVKVRVVGRSGARNQHGARVCVVQSGVGAHWGCRVVVRSLWSVWLGDVHCFLS